MSIPDASDNIQLSPGSPPPEEKRPRRRNPLLRALGGVGFVLVVALLLTFNAVLVWVATGPRDLNPMLPYVESALAEGQSAYTVKIGKGLLLWDGWRHPVDIRLHDVNIYTAQGERFASFPNVSLGLDLVALAFARVVPTSLEIRKPVISLFQAEDGTVSFGFPAGQEAQAEQAASGNPVAGILAAFSQEERGGLRKLKRIEITDADVSIGDMKRGVFASAQHVYMKLRNTKNTVRCTLSAELVQDKTGSEFPATVSINAQSAAGGGVQGSVHVQQLWPPALAPLLADSTDIAGVKLPINAEVAFALNADGSMSGARFAIAAGQGSVENARLAEKLPISHANAEGSVQGTTGLVLDSFSAVLDGYGLQGNAALERAEKGLGITGSVTAQDVPIDHIARFWPPSLAPESRKWVVTNITGGVAKTAQLEANIEPGMLDLPALPEGSINATIRFENSGVRFLPEHPPLKNVFGEVQVGAVALKGVDLRGTTLSGTQVEKGNLLIPDLNVDNPRIEVEFHATTPAADVVSFLSREPARHAARLGLTEQAGGSAAGNVKLGFYFYAPPGPDGKPRDDMGVDYLVQAELKNISQPGFLKKFDISDGNGQFFIDNAGLKFDGTGTVNTVPAKAQVSYLFKPKDGFDTFLEVQAAAPVSALPRFGYPDLPFLAGNIGVQAKMRQGPAAEISEADIDLKDATITWKEMGWTKPAGQAARLTLEAEKKDGALRFPRFALSGQGVSAKGSLAFKPDLSGVSQVECTDCRLLDTSLSYLRFEPTARGWKLEARGEKADATGWLEGGDDFSFSEFPDIDLTLDVGALTLGEGRVLRAVKGSMRCGPRCEADMAGQTAGGKAFEFRITPSGQGRVLSAKAEDGGALLKALDVYEGMTGGELSLDGSFDAEGRLTGTLDIGEHVIQNAPTLARLLSLASLTGLIDTLGGKGVMFKKLHAPFSLHNDVITLHDAKTHGPAMGLSAEGTIRFPGQKFDLKGVIAPSYTLNTVLGKVPLIGDVLTGGGEGVFAARYTITGPHDKLDVSVNPLSILTPGFLRGLFDIGGRKEEDTISDKQ